MNNEPFTREPGYLYRLNNGHDVGPTDGWEIYSPCPVSRWISTSMAYFGDYGPGYWFRRRLPVAPMADGWVKFSDREPRPDEYPIAARWSGWNETHPSLIWLEFQHETDVHEKPKWLWQRIVMPTPPQAPSQQELDARAGCDSWNSHGIKVHQINHASTYHSGFIEGVRHGRANPA